MCLWRSQLAHETHKELHVSMQDIPRVRTTRTYRMNKYHACLFPLFGVGRDRYDTCSYGKSSSTDAGEELTAVCSLFYEDSCI